LVLYQPAARSTFPPYPPGRCTLALPQGGRHRHTGTCRGPLPYRGRTRQEDTSPVLGRDRSWRPRAGHTVSPASRGHTDTRREQSTLHLHSQGRTRIGHTCHPPSRHCSGRLPERCRSHESRRHIRPDHRGVPSSQACRHSPLACYTPRVCSPSWYYTGCTPPPGTPYCRCTLLALHTCLCLPPYSWLDTGPLSRTSRTIPPHTCIQSSSHRIRAGSQAASCSPCRTVHCSPGCTCIFLAQYKSRAGDHTQDRTLAPGRDLLSSHPGRLSFPWHCRHSSGRPNSWVDKPPPASPAWPAPQAAGGTTTSSQQGARWSGLSLISSFKSLKVSLVHWLSQDSPLGNL